MNPTCPLPFPAYHGTFDGTFPGSVGKVYVDGIDVVSLNTEISALRVALTDEVANVRQAAAGEAAALRTEVANAQQAAAGEVASEVAALRAEFQNAISSLTVSPSMLPSQSPASTGPTSAPTKGPTSNPTVSPSSSHRFAGAVSGGADYQHHSARGMFDNRCRAA